MKGVDIVHTVIQVIQQIENLLAPAAKATWGLAVKQVIVQGDMAMFWVVAEFLIFVGFYVFLRRSWNFAVTNPHQWNYNNQWIPFGVGGAIIVILTPIIVVNMANNIGLAITNLINPGWAAIQLLLHVAK